jgi:hypothetical protein
MRTARYTTRIDELPAVKDKRLGKVTARGQRL